MNVHILFHLGGAIVFCCLFWLGKSMDQGRDLWAVHFLRLPIPAPHLCSFFFYAGRLLEVTAFTGALVEIVAVMVLSSGLLVALLFGI